MKSNPQSVIKTYLLLTGLSTAAASLIWGVNTLFLLDAGLSNLEAFSANAFFTVGQVLFEVPTGVVADAKGRKLSYLLGAAVLMISTVLYIVMWQIQAPFIGWAAASAVLGLGFTFFSGATEAWLVDALNFTGYKGELEDVFAKGQVTGGIAMLAGSLSGGLIAQTFNLAAPYALRIVILAITLIVAAKYMKDLGFKPKTGKSSLAMMKSIFADSLTHGLKKPSTRWIMLTAPFMSGAGVYAFYAMQPYLLELYGDTEAYWIAGMAAAIIAGAQIAGGIAVGYIRKMFKKRTTILGIGTLVSALSLAAIGIFDNFWAALATIVIWAIAFAAAGPVRSAYLNKLIPSEQRATVLSFDSLLGSSGAVISQPSLGKAADVWGYAVTYIFVSIIRILALPFILLARQTKTEADVIVSNNISSK